MSDKKEIQIGKKVGVNRKKETNIKMKDAFRVMNRGSFYWKLLVVPMFGALIAEATYFFSNIAQPFTFEALFYSFLIGGVSFIGTDVRDGMLSKGMLERYLLWPLDRKKKMGWLYLRSTWLPGILFFLGGLANAYFLGENMMIQLLYGLPYAGVAIFMLSFVIWWGSFTPIDLDALVNVSFRIESGISRINLLLILMPLGLMFLPAYMNYLVALLLLTVGGRIILSDKIGLQLGGDSLGVKENLWKESEEKHFEIASRMEKIKNPLYRYYYYLEWEEHRRPIQSYLIILSSVFFIVTIYYGLAGFLFQGKELLERSVFLGLLIGYSTYFIHHTAGMTISGKELLLLLPVSSKEKAMGNFLHRYLRPTLYIVMNAMFIGVVMGIVHLILQYFFSQQGISIMDFSIQTLYYSVTLLPFFIAIFSMGEFIIKGSTVAIQRMGFHKIRNLIFAGGFILYLSPFVPVLFFISEEPLMIKRLMGFYPILIYLTIFLISQWGSYYMDERIQVISS